MAKRETSLARFKERALEVIFMLCALTAVIGVMLVFIFVSVKGLPIFQHVGLTELLFSLNWAPSKSQFGILPLIIGSFLVTIGALALGAPMAILTAIFLSEVAPKSVQKIVRPAVELLAGIPSVIYGFFGLLIVIPMVRSLFGGSGFGLLTGWIVLAIMILPTIATISEDAIRAVPRSYREASFAMGATKWQTIWRVILPAAKTGIIGAAILGMGRAVGETMAVLMVLGNTPILPKSIVGPVATLTSIIALDMSYASGDHQTALFAMGIVLFIISFLFVGGIRFVSRRA
ncbi:MAG: phosphate ABC transporter permease subunit PstC [Actinomycetota bacterium]